MNQLKRIMPRVISVLLITVVLVLFSTTAYAAGGTSGGGDFGKKAYDWLSEQVQWIALLVVAVICVPFIMKKMWMQLVGFLVLAAIVLYIVYTPESLKTLGSTIWSKLIG